MADVIGWLRRFWMFWRKGANVITSWRLASLFADDWTPP